jgi:hypothetical protein
MRQTDTHRPVDTQGQNSLASTYDGVPDIVSKPKVHNGVACFVNLKIAADKVMLERDADEYCYRRSCLP